MPMVKESLRRCIDTCSSCHEVCLETITYCLSQGGRHVEAGHLRLMLDCAQICETSADFMIRGSEHHKRTCGVCAEICDQCARSCAAFEGDAEMQRCAEICRRCAEECRQMAA